MDTHSRTLIISFRLPSTDPPISARLKLAAPQFKFRPHSYRPPVFSIVIYANLHLCSLNILVVIYSPIIRERGKKAVRNPVQTISTDRSVPQPVLATLPLGFRINVAATPSWRSSSFSSHSSHLHWTLAISFLGPYQPLPSPPPLSYLALVLLPTSPTAAAQVSEHTSREVRRRDETGNLFGHRGWSGRGR